MYESPITFVSNDEEKLTITEEKEDYFGQKTKKAENAFQNLFTIAIDKGKSIASEKAKKLAAINSIPPPAIPQKNLQILQRLGRWLRTWPEPPRMS